MQSSVSLQHLPYNAELETQLPKDLQSRLAFAKQKVAEIAAAAKASPSSGVSLTAALPPVSESSEPDLGDLLMPACRCLHTAHSLQASWHACLHTAWWSVRQKRPML